MSGADETLERRRGAKIAHLGCFRDAAHSSKQNKVKRFGLRWVSMMVLGAVPWNARVRALPFLTVVAHSAPDLVVDGGLAALNGILMDNLRAWTGGLTQ